MTPNIKAFLEADALRTQGEWHWDGMRAEVQCRFGSCIAAMGGYTNGSDNATFIAAASRIAPDIRAMQDALEQVCEALEGVLPRGGMHYDHVRKALTAAAPYRKLIGGV